MAVSQIAQGDAVGAVSGELLFRDVAQALAEGFDIGV